MEIVLAFISSFIGSCVPHVLNIVIAFQAATGEITGGRAKALATVAVGLISVILGGIAWARGRSGVAGRFGAKAAIVLGLIGLAASVLHIAGSTGFGTGGGKAGAIVALVLSVAGAGLGGLKEIGSLRT